MSVRAIYDAIKEIRPPELFGYGKEELFRKYEICLSEIDPRDNDDKCYILEAMKERLEEIVMSISDDSLQNYLNGEIKRREDIPLLLSETKELTNIPYIVADWIGLIAYTKEKYIKEGIIA